MKYKIKAPLHLPELTCKAQLTFAQFRSVTTYVVMLFFTGMSLRLLLSENSEFTLKNLWVNTNKELELRLMNTTYP